MESRHHLGSEQLEISFSGMKHRSTGYRRSARRFIANGCRE